MLVAKPPTATHCAAEVQSTALRAVNTEPAGLGVGCTAQVLPFHRSARLLVGSPPPATGDQSPAATHTAAAGHDTPLSVARRLPRGGATCSRAQVLPLPASASGPWPEKPTQKPTEVHAVALLQDTELSSSCIWLPGLS